MAHVISESRQAAGGWGIPETVAKELAEILETKWGGNMTAFAKSCKVKPDTVYSILTNGGGKASLELINKLAAGLGCSKSQVAKALSKPSPESRKKALNALCGQANISLNELNRRCWGEYSYIYQVINSSKRTQNFLKVVEGFGLDVERFEEYYLVS